MSNAFVGTVLMLALVAPATAQDQAPRLVTMTGYGTLQASPDRAWVTVGVEKRDPQTKVAQQQTAVAMDQIQQRLKALGIPDTSIRTSSFNVTQEWEFQPPGRRTLRGYIVSNQLEVKVDDIAKVPAIIDGSLEAGANIIQGVQWDIKNRDTLEQQALRLAFEDARRRAGVIVTASGATLGPVGTAYEQRSALGRQPMAMRYQAGVGGFAETAQNVTVINPGEMEIRAVVTVSFLIQG